MRLQECPGLSCLLFLPIFLGTVCFPSLSESGDHPSFTHSLGPAPPPLDFPRLVPEQLRSCGWLGGARVMPLVLRFPNIRLSFGPSLLYPPPTHTILQNLASQDSPLQPLRDTSKGLRRYSPSSTSCSPQSRSRLPWSAQLHASSPWDSPGEAAYKNAHTAGT